jgi:hypothetical protein
MADRDDNSDLALDGKKKAREGLPFRALLIFLFASR